MEANKIQELQKKLDEVTNMFSDEDIANMTPEQRVKVAETIAKMEARINALKEVL